MIEPVLLDNSAWVRLGLPQLGLERKQEVAAAIDNGLVRICLPFLLEAGYSARNASDHDQLCAELLALPWVGLDHDVENRAIEAQRQLARAAHHRLPPSDLLIAALADRHGLGILHYDRDFDLIAAKTGLHYESIWLADKGSL